RRAAVGAGRSRAAPRIRAATRLGRDRDDLRPVRAGGRMKRPKGKSAAATPRPVKEEGPSPLARWSAAVVSLLVLVFFYPITSGKVFLSPDSVAPAGLAHIALEAL